MGLQLASIGCHDGPVNTIGFGATSDIVFSGGADGTLQQSTWESDGAATTQQLTRGRGNVSALSQDEDSRYLLAGYSDGRIEIINIPNGARSGVLNHHSDLVAGIAQHPQNSNFLSASYDGTVAICDYPSGTVQQFVDVPYQGPVTAIAYARSGKQFAASGLRSPLTIWDSTRLSVARRLGSNSRTVVSMAYSPVSDHLVTASFEGELCIYDLDREGVSTRLQLEEQGEYPVTVSNDGTKIAVGTDTSVNIYTLGSGELSDYYHVSNAGVFSVAFAPTTDVLAVGRGDGKVLLMDPASDSTPSSA